MKSEPREVVVANLALVFWGENYNGQPTSTIDLDLELDTHSPIEPI